MPPSPKIRSGTYVSFRVRPIKSSPMSTGSVAAMLDMGSMKSALRATKVSSVLGIARGERRDVETLTTAVADHHKSPPRTALHSDHSTHTRVKGVLECNITPRELGYR